MRRLVLLALLALGACDGGQEMEIGWTFGELTQHCAEAGVQTVHVFIGPLESSGFYDAEVHCEVGDAPARLTMRGLAPGRHMLVVKGLAHDQTRFLLEREIDVPPGAGYLGRFQLPAYVPVP